jgi:hypothetical protein
VSAISLLVGQMSFRIDRLAVLAGAERLGGDVLPHIAEQRVGDHQRRAGEVVGAHVGVHAALEIAVAGEHRDGDQLVVLDGVDDGVVQRAGIADAGGAAIADGVEAERVQIGLQAGLVEIFGDHLAAGRERGLHPGLRRQAQRARLAGHQAGGDQHIGVGGVGAAGDGGDHHVAMADFVVLAGDGFFAACRVASGTPRLLVSSALKAGGVLQQHAVLRALRAGEAGLHGGEVEFQRVGEHRVGRPGRATCPGPWHRLPPARCGARRGRSGADSRATLRPPGRSRRWRRIPGPCWRWWRGRPGPDGPGRAEEFDELADHALLAQHLRDGQHEVGGGRALRQLAGQFEADHVGDQHGDGLAEHGGLRLDAADAPAQHAHAVDHGGVAVGAVQRVRIGEGLAAILGGPDDLGEVFQVHLVADAGAGRHDAEIVERFLAPAQEA